MALSTCCGHIGNMTAILRVNHMLDLSRRTMKKDATFKWDDKDFVNFYTDSANFIVLERQRSIRILLEIVAFHFPSLSGLHILDLGCGEGIITQCIFTT